MRKTLLSAIVAMSLIACKENAKNQDESSSEKSEIKTEVNDSITHKDSEITFENYKSEYTATKKKADIDFNSNPTAKDFKSAISEAYKNENVNFAGNYIIATWGCGTSCISGAMIDVRDGKVYDLPSDNQWEGIGNSYKSDKASSLLITGFSGYGIEATKYWKWNESNKKFEFIKTVELETEDQK